MVFNFNHLFNLQLFGVDDVMRSSSTRVLPFWNSTVRLADVIRGCDTPNTFSIRFMIRLAGMILTLQRVFHGLLYFTLSILRPNGVMRPTTSNLLRSILCRLEGNVVMGNRGCALMATRS
jgi:hypothetical protein